MIKYIIFFCLLVLYTIDGKANNFEFINFNSNLIFIDSVITDTSRTDNKGIVISEKDLNDSNKVSSDSLKTNKWQSFEVEKPPECINLEAVASGITYPDSAKENGIEGKVTVKILVSEEGSVYKLGKMTGPEIFFETVKKASWGLLFTPGLQQGKPVKVWVTVPFNFKVDKK